MADLKRLLCSELKRQLGSSDTRCRVPAGGELLWRWFLDLSKTRSIGAVGPNPISFTEIDAYARLHQLPLTGTHVEILTAMDSSFLAACAEIRERLSSGAKRLPAASEHRMSAGMFDAMFG